VSSIRFDLEFAHGSQPFDKANKVLLARRFQPFPQPCERRTALFIIDDEQSSFGPGNRRPGI
jgi:hypothetical protein